MAATVYVHVCHKIVEFLDEAIDFVDPSNVLSVSVSVSASAMSNNVANCKVAGMKVEKGYKHIFWSSCYVHTLNLIFKDFASEFIWLNDT